MWTPPPICAMLKFMSVLWIKQEKEALKGLKSAAGYLRRELGAALQLRYTPELVFEADDSIAHGTHILEVLRGIEEKEGLLEEGDKTP
mgnify:CR=1 FL=1